VEANSCDRGIDRWRAGCIRRPPVEYIRLPPPRANPPHRKAIAVLVAAVFGTAVIEMARCYERPLPPIYKRHHAITPAP
jgi:hypothetical protein